MGMCRRSCPVRSIFCRKATKTATPPKGVTARLVSRRISRSLDSRAAISRGTDLSAVLVSIPLLSQTLTVDAQPNLGNEAKKSIARRIVQLRVPGCRLETGAAAMAELAEYRVSCATRSKHL